MNIIPVSVIILLTTLADTAHSTDVEHFYKSLRPDQNFTGTLNAELTVKSKIECGMR